MELYVLYLTPEEKHAILEKEQNQKA